MFKRLLTLVTLSFLFLAESQTTDVLRKYPNPKPPVTAKNGPAVAGKGAQKANTPAPVRPLPPPPSPQALLQQNKDTCSPICQKTLKMSPILILSIDGASVRGIAQFKLLQAIEKQVPERFKIILHEKNILPNSSNPKTITDIFDYIAGTSAGSLNAGSIAIPANPATSNLPGQKPTAKYTLEAINALLPKTLEAAFSTSTFRKIRTLKGLLGSKYTAKDLEDHLQYTSGKTRMSDLVKPTLITSYDLRNRNIANFSTYEACRRKGNDEVAFMMPDENGNMIKDNNVYVWQAMRASSAAPTYYKPLEIKSGGKDRALIDAGLYVMSPTMLAWREAKKVYPCRRIVIISISSGALVDNVRTVRTKGATAGSIPAVLEATIETALEGQQLLTDEMMKDLDIDYHRLTFDVSSKTFDDFSEKNIQLLEQAAESAVQRKDFEDAIKAIVGVHVERLNDPVPTVFICDAKQDDVKKAEIARNYAGLKWPAQKATR